ncbi:hypothetical protein JCM12298_27190 [Desulfothermus naphthae]
MSDENKKKIPAEKPIKDIAKKKVPPSDKEYIIEKMERPEPWPDPPPEKEGNRKEKE